MLPTPPLSTILFVSLVSFHRFVLDTFLLVAFVIVGVCAATDDFARQKTIAYWVQDEMYYSSKRHLRKAAKADIAFSQRRPRSHSTSFAAAVPKGRFGSREQRRRKDKTTAVFGKDVVCNDASPSMDSSCFRLRRLAAGKNTTLFHITANRNPNGNSTNTGVEVLRNASVG